MNECVADAAGEIRQLASAGVSAVAELSASVADEAVAELAASVVHEAFAELVDDKSFLDGRVPQVDEWVVDWAESTEHVSFRKQARI